MMITFPRFLTIDTHNYCNARCGYCPYHGLSRDGEYLQGVMDKDLYRRLIGELASERAHVEAIRFGNLAESLILDVNWWFMEVLLGEDLPFYITSNMTHLTPEAMVRLDALGFKGDVLAHVQPGMGVDFETQKKNYEVALARWGSKRVWIVAPEGTGVRKWAGDPTITQRKAVRCEVDRPYTSMIIGWDGRVQLCCVDTRQEVIVGDVKKNTIREVWNGPDFNGARERLSSGVSDLCNQCEWGVADGRGGPGKSAERYYAPA